MQETIMTLAKSFGEDGKEPPSPKLPLPPQIVSISDELVLATSKTADPEKYEFDDRTSEGVHCLSVHFTRRGDSDERPNIASIGCGGGGDAGTYLVMAISEDGGHQIELLDLTIRRMFCFNKYLRALSLIFIERHYFQGKVFNSLNLNSAPFLKNQKFSKIIFN